MSFQVFYRFFREASLIFAALRLYYYKACLCLETVFQAKAGQNTFLRRKPDMFEADTTYLWQTSRGVDAKTLCASAPVSLFQAQSELNFVCANTASKQYRPPAANASAVCSFTTQAQVCDSFLNQTSSAFLLQERFGAPKHLVCEQHQHTSSRHGHLRTRAGFFVFPKHDSTSYFSII